MHREGPGPVHAWHELSQGAHLKSAVAYSLAAHAATHVESAVESNGLAPMQRVHWWSSGPLHSLQYSLSKQLCREHGAPLYGLSQPAEHTQLPSTHSPWAPHSTPSHGPLSTISSVAMLAPCVPLALHSPPESRRRRRERARRRVPPSEASSATTSTMRNRAAGMPSRLAMLRATNPESKNCSVVTETPMESTTMESVRMTRALSVPARQGSHGRPGLVSVCGPHRGAGLVSMGVTSRARAGESMRVTWGARAGESTSAEDHV